MHVFSRFLYQLMSLHVLLTLLLLTLLLILLLIPCYYLWCYWYPNGTSGRSLNGSSPPEPSGALPILGHLLQLSGTTTLARTWSHMADQYGPIFTFRLAVHRCVIVSSREAVKECLTTHDKILASRPKSNAGVFLGYNYAAFGFAPYGEFWRQMRKLAVVELLSTRRLDELKHVRVSEVGEFIKDLRDSNGVVEISHKFEMLSLNLMIRMIAGKRYFVGGRGGGHDGGEAERVARVVKEFMYVSGVFVPSDVIPWLRWIDFKGQVTTMKRVGEEIDELVGSWVEEHKQRRRRRRRRRMREEGEEDHRKEDFIDFMLDAMEEHEYDAFGYTRDTIIKATVMNLLLAGSDTTSITLTWILANLMNKPTSLKLAQQELDDKIGRTRLVQDSDIPDLPYLHAVIKETLRLYPPGPVSVPHEATQDLTVAGYSVPKGTRIFFNLWKLHRDPQVWSHPEEFLPERFLKEHADVDVVGQNFELIPFGSGRRSCPGMTLALQVTHLVMARLLQAFELTTVPFGGPVDMREGMGITLPKAKPLEVLLSPRLPPHFYE